MSADTADLNTLSLGFADELFNEYLRDPAAVTADWRSYFDSLSAELNGKAPKKPAGPSFAPTPLFRTGAAPNGTNGHSNGRGGSRNGYKLGATVPSDMATAIRQDWLDQLVRAYRRSGHYVAQIDPLGSERPPQPELDPAHYGFGESDWESRFSTDTISGAWGPQLMTLRQVVDRLRNTYCRSIGVEYMHIDDRRVRVWMQERMESTENRLQLTRAEQIRILTRLTDAVVFEDFLTAKYAGKKTFSLKGGESLIPLLDLAIEKAGEQNVDQVIVAMAHRGRLNVLANIMGKSPAWIFRELDDPDVDSHRYRYAGDVKYHLGFSRDVTTSSDRKVHVSLCFNPSHLEYVNPVALGRLRAMQDRCSDMQGDRSVAILIHGDAAFIGEGIIQETFNLSNLPAYSTGGTIHVVINNQIGFTTPEWQGRSCTYTTDIAKMLPIPIFHVNGEDPEAVAQVVRLALDFRKEFRRDVVIDMYCYRYYGHNEMDEPAFTSPLMYKKIRARKSVLSSYLDFLVGMNGITQADASRIASERQALLEAKLTEARAPDFQHRPAGFTGVWNGFVGGDDAKAAEAPTGAQKERLAALMDKLTHLPAGFTPHRNIARLLENRRKMAEGIQPFDWGAAESLAFASLATEPGRQARIRMTGQDCERGTFSHRHAVLHDVENGAAYAALQHLAIDQAAVDIVNSPLSEAAVLGYEWGYSLKYPDGLVLWEAQYGDFSNCAQVIIDQFLSSAEDKWKLLSGLVMLLPHGFEGAGPEHSSARLERFLALAAEDNMQIVNLTTPAQYFHCLRRQVLRQWRKPLIVMTPKSLLRDDEAVSTLDDLATGRFHRILPDLKVPAGPHIKRILLCSGKVYYDLERYRREHNRRDVAILRLEQLYPLPPKLLLEALAPYAPKTPLVWVQEEPRNMGAWYFLNVHLDAEIRIRHPLHGVYRPESASPATGSTASHKHEQKELVEQAFAG